MYLCMFLSKSMGVQASLQPCYWKEESKYNILLMATIILLKEQVYFSALSPCEIT